MGARDGSIIATIIATHMPMNDAAALGHVCPHIRIHVMDIDQPPGIGISPIADMDAHQTTVTAALAAKSSAETPKKARWETRSETLHCGIFYSAFARTRPRPGSALAVLVVTLPPDACFVASLGRAVKPLVHVPDAVHATRIGGVRVIDDAVLKHERTDAGSLA